MVAQNKRSTLPYLLFQQVFALEFSGNNKVMQTIITKFSYGEIQAESAQFVAGAAAGFGGGPGDDAVGVGDFTGFAVQAV